MLLMEVPPGWVVLSDFELRNLEESELVVTSVTTFTVATGSGFIGCSLR